MADLFYSPICGHPLRSIGLPGEVVCPEMYKIELVVQRYQPGKWVWLNEHIEQIVQQRGQSQI